MSRSEESKDGGRVRALAFADAGEAYRALSGEALPEERLAELLWYERLRRRLVGIRKAAECTQNAVANAIGVTQSEVSRLENTLGPGTQLGTVRAYLEACDSSPDALFAPEPAGGQGGEPAPGGAEGGIGEAPAAGAGDAPGEPLVRIEDREFRGAEAVGVLECIGALNNLLIARGVAAEERKEQILGFLEHLRREPAHAAVALEIPVLQRPRPRAMSYAAFLSQVAGPLELSDF